MQMLNYTQSGKKYAAIFTNLDNDPTGSIRENMSLESNGYTCCWVIAKSRQFDKILLYIRENGRNNVYEADYNYREYIEARRYKVYYKNMIFLEETFSNWMEFAGTQSPVRYVDT